MSKSEAQSQKETKIRQAKTFPEEKLDRPEPSSFQKKVDGKMQKSAKVLAPITILKSKDKTKSSVYANQRSRVAPMIKPKGTQALKQASISLLSESITRPDHNDPPLKISLPQKKPNIKISKFDFDQTNLHVPESSSYRSQTSERDVESQDSATSTKKQKSSFLAPTVSMLQHLKEVTYSKGENEKRFSFSKPKEALGEYYPDIADGSRRESFVSTSGVSNHSNGDKISSLRRQILKKAIKNSPFLQSPRQEGMEELKFGEKNEVKRRISNILTRELEARWGVKLNSCNSTPEKEIQVSQEIKKKVAILIPQKDVKDEESGSKLESPEYQKVNSARLESKPWFMNQQYYIEDKILRGERNNIKKEKSEDNLINRNQEYIENEKDSPAWTLEGENDKNSDIFCENSVNFFKFNEDSKLLNAIKNRVGSQWCLENKKNIPENTPLIVELGANNKIIQPAYMTTTGSMCFTEFWSKKLNTTFSRHANNKSKHIRIKRVERENETVYRPSHWTKQKKIRDRIVIDHLDAWGAQSLTFSKQTDRSNSFGSKKGTLSPQREDSQKSFVSSSRMNPPSLLERFGAAERTSSQTKLKIQKYDQGENQMIKLKNSLPELKPSFSSKSKLYYANIDENKPTNSPYLSIGNIPLEGETIDGKARIIRFNDIKDLE